MATLEAKRTGRCGGNPLDHRAGRPGPCLSKGKHMSRIIYFQRLKSIGVIRLDLDSCLVNIHITYQDLSEEGASEGKRSNRHSI